MIEKTTDVNQRNVLGQGLSALAGKLDAAQAQAVVAEVCGDDREDHGRQHLQLNALGQGSVHWLASSMPPRPRR